MIAAVWNRYSKLIPALVIASSSLLLCAPAAGKTTPAAKSGSRVQAKSPSRIKVVVPAASRSPRAAIARNSGGVRRAVMIENARVGRGSVPMRKVVAMVAPRASMAALRGLRFAPETVLGDLEDPSVKSSVALVLDETTHGVLYSRNPTVALPIASITKLMTALVVLDAHQPMDEEITITNDDLDTEKFSRSRLAVGTALSRSDMMLLALMSSENRAAHALGRSYPGGVDVFVRAMNAKARALGMSSARFDDPTGLSSGNVASAEDLVKLVDAASANPTVRQFSTNPNYSVPVGKRILEFRNTNALVANPDWDIVVQKTGYISEAGKCLVMKAMIEGRPVIIVLLDSFGKFTRLGDANRIRQWMENQPVTDPIARVIKKSS